MIVSKCHSARIEKALCDFYAHAKEQKIKPAFPRHTRKEMPYYELDAHIVDALLDVMEKAGYDNNKE